MAGSIVQKELSSPDKNFSRLSVPWASRASAGVPGSGLVISRSALFAAPSLVPTSDLSVPCIWPVGIMPGFWQVEPDTSIASGWRPRATVTMTVTDVTETGAPELAEASYSFEVGHVAHSSAAWYSLLLALDRTRSPPIGSLYQETCSGQVVVREDSSPQADRSWAMPTRPLWAVKPSPRPAAWSPTLHRSPPRYRSELLLRPVPPGRVCPHHGREQHGYDHLGNRDGESGPVPSCGKLKP